MASKKLRKLHYEIISNLIASAGSLFAVFYFQQYSAAETALNYNPFLGILFLLAIIMSLYAGWEKAKHLSNAIRDHQTSQRVFAGKVGLYFFLASAMMIAMNAIFAFLGCSMLNTPEALTVVIVLSITIGTLVIVIIQGFKMGNFDWQPIPTIEEKWANIGLSIHKIIGVTFAWHLMVRHAFKVHQEHNPFLVQLIYILLLYACFILPFSRFVLIENKIEMNSKQWKRYLVSVALVAFCSIFPLFWNS